MIYALRALCAALLTLAVASGASAAGTPIELNWAELVPPALVTQQQAVKSKSFLSGATPFASGSEQPPPTPLDPEAPWLSQRRLQPVPVVRVIPGGISLDRRLHANAVKRSMLSSMKMDCFGAEAFRKDEFLFLRFGMGRECPRVRYRP